jgi:hypothetical protein
MTMATVIAHNDVPWLNASERASGVGFLPNVGMGCAEEYPS